jgi:general secretion pathway protein I
MSANGFIDARRRGFTLIEVMIAMFVIALGVGALLTTLTSSADAAAHLREKSLAEWIALNRVSEVRLANARPAAGTTSGTIDYAGRTWRWQQTVNDPGIAGILRLDVLVAPQSTGEQLRLDVLVAPQSTGEQTESTAEAKSAFPALGRAIGFFGTSVAPGSGNIPDWSLAAAPAAGGPGGPGAPGAPAGGKP